MVTIDKITRVTIDMIMKDGYDNGDTHDDDSPKSRFSIPWRAP